MAALVLVGGSDDGAKHPVDCLLIEPRIELEGAASGQPDGNRFGRWRRYRDGNKLGWERASFSTGRSWALRRLRDDRIL